MFSYLKTPCSTPEFALALHSAIQNTPPAVLAGLHVLVADDNQINRKVEQKIIEKATSILTKKAPRRVTQPSRRVRPLQMAEDGLQAVELAKKNRFDLILMDLDMPNMVRASMSFSISCFIRGLLLTEFCSMSHRTEWMPRQRSANGNARTISREHKLWACIRRVR
jgi:hypothetical protein